MKLRRVVCAGVAGQADDTEDRSAEQIATDEERALRMQAARFHDTRRTYAHLMPQDHDRARSIVQAAFERDAACHERVTGTGG